MSAKTTVLLEKAANALPASNPLRGEIETALKEMKAEHAARAKRAFTTMRENLKRELLAEIAAETKGGKPVAPAAKAQPARAA